MREPHRLGIGRAGNLLPEAILCKVADAADVPVVLLLEARQHLFDMCSPQVYWNGSKLPIPAQKRPIQQCDDCSIAHIACRNQTWTSLRCIRSALSSSTGLLERPTLLLFTVCKYRPTSAGSPGMGLVIVHSCEIFLGQAPFPDVLAHFLVPLSACTCSSWHCRNNIWLSLPISHFESMVICNAASSDGSFLWSNYTAIPNITSMPEVFCPQKTSVSTTVANAVLNAFRRLPKTGKPQGHEHTVLAGNSCTEALL